MKRWLVGAVVSVFLLSVFPVSAFAECSTCTSLRTRTVQRSIVLFTPTTYYTALTSAAGSLQSTAVAVATTVGKKAVQVAEAVAVGYVVNYLSERFK